MDLINVARMFDSNGNTENCADFVEQNDIHMVIYRFTQFMKSNIFNYHAFFKDLSVTSFVENPNTVPCAYSNFDPKYINKQKH